MWFTLYRDQDKVIYARRELCQCAERMNSELPSRLQCLESLSLVTSNIFNSPQDHDDAYTAKSPKTNEETEKWRFRSPAFMAVEKRMDEEVV